MIIGFIGTGAITEAVVCGLFRAKYPIDRFLVSARNAEIAARLAKTSTKVEVVPDNQQIADHAEIVFLAVRPQIARSVIEPLHFPDTAKVVSFLAATTSETVEHWVGNGMPVTRAIPLPSVAELAGITAIYPGDDVVEQIFGSLGQVVTATTLNEFDGYAAASALMGTYFGLLETSAAWMVENGAPYSEARSYLDALFLGLAKSTVVSSDPFDKLRIAHSTPQGLNEQVWKTFKAGNGADALAVALTGAFNRIKSSLKF